MLRPIRHSFLAEYGVELVPATVTDKALEALDPRKVQEGMVATVTVPPVLLTAEATLEAQVAAAAPLADLPVARAWVLALCSLVRVAVVSTSTPSCST